MCLRPLVPALSVCAVGLTVATPVALGGPLNPPPGPVASTFKTLTEVEPRIAINAENTPGDNDATPSLFKITQPGSYYLTGNVTGVAGKHGIEIAASNVTLDLEGFALIGTASSLSGVFSTTTTGVAIVNGAVANWDDCGIDVQLIAGQVENVVASSNGNWGIRNSLNGNGSKIAGCEVHFNGSLAGGLGGGISMSNDAMVVDCLASNNRGDGIVVFTGRILNCMSNVNQGDGIEGGVKCTVTGCTAADNMGKGIALNGDSNLVSDCSATQNGSDGIFTFDQTTITDCVAARNSGGGIVARAGCEVAHCVANTNFGDGIQLNGSNSTARACTAYFNGQGAVTAHGINSTGLGSSILDCTVGLNLSDGIRVAGRSRVVGNNCQGNGFAASDGAGIHSTSSDNHIEGNTVTGNDRGIDVDSIGSLIVRNTAKVNTTNFSIIANNKVGVIVAAPNSVAINGSTGGAGVGTTDPWANISY